MYVCGYNWLFTGHVEFCLCSERSTEVRDFVVPTLSKLERLSPENHVSVPRFLLLLGYGHGH
jgi:hypothetical protein